MTALHSSEHKRILRLEAMWAVAALCLLMRPAVQAASFVTADTGLVYLVLANGFLGVNLFFILSGWLYFYLYQQRALRYVRCRKRTLFEQPALAGPAWLSCQEKGVCETTRGSL